jgi:transposase
MIKEATKVDKRTINRMRFNLDFYDELYPPKWIQRKPGRRPNLSPLQEDWVFEFLSDRPTAYLDEIQQALYDEFEVETSERSLHRLIEKRGWSRKATQLRATQQCEELRTAWRGRQSEWHIDDICFVDESAANERTGDRKWGWAPIGQAAINYVPLKRTKRWSCLPALTSKGYLDDPLVIQGSITAELFNTWIEYCIIPQLNFDGQPRIILDNARIHHSEELKEICARNGVELTFLPPYSPDMNPIEKTFSMLKAWVKRNYLLVSTFTTVGAFMQYAMAQLKLDEAAVNLFREAGYTNSLDEE